jgi:carbamoyl-phosphate synthase large subunit
MVVIEMNPRVSRSSALASKATGFPIAKIAAKLATGYRLDEITNDITKKTPACFEPTIDYVAVKIPRWDFEKFPGNSNRLSSQMKSVGEAMGIGRTFKEAINKTLRSLENGWSGFHANGQAIYDAMDKEALVEDMRFGTPDRLLKIWRAFTLGMTPQDVFDITDIDIWFLQNLYQLFEFEKKIVDTWQAKGSLEANMLRRAKQYGFSDQHLGLLTGTSETDARQMRIDAGIVPSYKIVDTCAAEFESFTPYFYSTYDKENESTPTQNKKVIILGGGPNRIGQGIEFDYCCVHGIMALKALGIQAIMINCNPETVSTDYDVADKLYFEPLTYEDVLNVIELEKPDGVIIQFGGQTPLKLALALEKAGVPIWGTSPDSVDLAEDRDRFGALLDSLSIPVPRYGTARSLEEALKVGETIGFPLMVRPSYVLGGRAMEIVYDTAGLEKYMTQAVTASEDHPVLLDRFLEDAFEFDVDAISDGEQVEICGIMQHIEEAGIHSGDSMAVMPPYLLSLAQHDDLKEYTRLLATALKVKGIINIQYAIIYDTIYVLEVNPRASRSIPFVSKVKGIPFAKFAVDIMAGKKLKEIGYTYQRELPYVAVKESVFPFDRFEKADIYLRPEMRSTGEVMGISPNFGQSVFKAFQATNINVPQTGVVFVSVNDSDKNRMIPIAEGLHALGWELAATSGTATLLSNRGLPVRTVLKVSEGRPNIVDDITNGEIHLIIKTPLGQRSRTDEFAIGWAAIKHRVPFITTLSAAESILRGLRDYRAKPFDYKCLQEYYQNLS